ncbi:hypothetical protein GCM10022244_56910 [Streptomyces gulbargensis]|uniref:LigA protein n=1 Tax=Streptomyces gulbargensis TaxID=364901 RepID=A0ABP7NBT0_9ACTN
MPHDDLPIDPFDRNDRSGRFEDELGAVLRTTGAAFAADNRPELVTGGLRRGRRRLVRRRLATTGGALGLVAVGAGGIHGAGLFAPSRSGAPAAVAQQPADAPAAPGDATAAEVPGEKDPQRATIPVDDLATVLRDHAPAGTWQIMNAGGTGHHVSGVYDDGRGRAAVTVGLYRAQGDGEAGAGQVTCPSKVHTGYDSCTTERLPNGSRLMVLQGYEYPDRRVDTKVWRAVLLTRDNFLVDASEYNAPAEKGAAVTRTDPPFTPRQLKALVTAEAWQPLLERLPVLPVRKPAADPGRPAEPSGPALQAALRSLLPADVEVTDQGGDAGYGYAVVDDGRGRSLVEINVQPDMSDVRSSLFGTGEVTTLPDGRLVKVEKRPGEKGGAGVVWWTVDTLTPAGFRVVVSAFNAGSQHEAATRPEPALTTEELKRIALSPKWQKLSAK